MLAATRIMAQRYGFAHIARAHRFHKGRNQVTTPTKEQVIAAVEAEIDPSTAGKMRIKPVALIALRRLLGKRRVSRQDQERLFWLVESVWQAIKRGDDPGIAYDAAIGAGICCLAIEQPRGFSPINRFRDEVRRRPPKRR
jgi:hypothetical protein